MRKLILTATGCMCLAGATYFLNSVVGQEKAARKEAVTEEIPHRIALIDLEYVFSNYEKLKYLREELKAGIQEEKNRFDEKVKKGQSMELELKDFKPDTPEYDAKRQRLEKLAADLQVDQKQSQNKLKRDNAKMHLTIYHEVHDSVEKFCKHHNYTLAMQFTRSEANSSDPQQMQRIVSQPIVYFRKADNGKCRDDLSEPVVKYLNDKYKRDSGADSDAAANDKPARKDKGKVLPVEGTAAPSTAKRVKTADQ